MIEGTPPPPPKISAVEKEFLEFWDVVERTDNKGGALKAWIKGRKSGRMPDLATVKAAYCRLAESLDWTKDGRQYHPQVATWLNREGWTETPRKGSAPKTLRNDFEIAQGTKETLAELFPED